MNIETKFSVGDVVYVGRAQWGENWVECPDCEGRGTWTIVANSRSFWEVDCQTCWHWRFGILRPQRSVRESTRVRFVERRTIGSVQINTAEDGHDSGVRYMCIETGVGSGQLYREEALWETEDDAQAFAQAQVDLQLPEARNEDERHRDRCRTNEVHHCTRPYRIRTRRDGKTWTAMVGGTAVEGHKTEKEAYKALAEKLAKKL